MRTIPKFILDNFGGKGAWIVGGGARYLIESDKSMKDWDIVIPYHESPNQLYLCEKLSELGALSINSCGGYEFRPNKHTSLHSIVGGIRMVTEIDFWYDDIGRILSESPFGKQGIAINIDNQSIITTSEYIVYELTGINTDISTKRKVRVRKV